MLVILKLPVLGLHSSMQQRQRLKTVDRCDDTKFVPMLPSMAACRFTSHV
jgi:hypothetical protein